MSLFEIPICPADDPTGTPTATLTEADVSALKISVSLNDLGEVRVTLPRNRWQSLGLDMRDTYYGRVKIPHIDADSYIQGFWLVGAEMILVSTDERGGEDITIGGPGPAWILTKAVLNHEEWTDHTGVYVQDGTWYFSGKSHGDILSILLAEDAANPHPALDGMESAGWGANLDVDGNTWEQFGGIFSQPVGTNYLDVIRQVQRGGEFEWWVTPNLNLRAFAGTYGRDLSGNSYGAGVVRFVGSDVTPDENRNIISQLTRRKDRGSQYTHVLVLGNDRREEGRVIEGSPIHRWAADPDWSSGDYVREGFMAYETNSTDILIRAGLRMIERSKDRSGRLAQFEVMPGRDESNGLYLPGAPGTDRGNYWIGDTVTIKTGGAEGIDFFNRDLRIARIRLELDQAAKDDTLETRDRSWHTFIETGDDAAPTSSAASVINEDGSHTCRCPSPGDPGDPGEPPTAPTEDFRWSFDDRGGIAFANTYADTTVLHGWTQAFWEDGPGSAWHDDYDEHISWSEAGATTDYIPVTAGVVYTFEADMSQRQSDSNVYLRVKWYTAGGVLLQTDYVAGPGIAVAVKTNYSTTVTAPATATQIRLQVDAANGEFGAADNIVMSHGGSGGTPATPGDDPVGQVGGSGQGVYAENDHYIPVGSILEHLHITDGGPYHDADQIAIDDAGTFFTGTEVEAALQEIGADLAAIVPGVTDHGALTGLSDDDHTQYILKSLVDAKGDILAGSAADTITRLGVGSDGQILSADSSQSTGLIWIDAPESSSGGGGAGEILIADTHSTPLIFGDLLQNEAQADLLYADTEESGGGGVTDHGSLTGLGDVDHNYVRGDSAKNYRMVACVVRKTGGSWVLLNDATHVPIGISGISSDSDSVDIAFDFTAAKIGAVVVGADETWAELYHFGPSVTTTEARVGITDMDGNPVAPTAVANSTSANFWLIGLMEV